MDRTVVRLTIPIDHNGLPIQEVAVRRPTVGDHLAASKMAGTDAEREVRLVAMLTDLPPEAIHRMDLADYRRIQEALMDFLSPSPASRIS